MKRLEQNQEVVGTDETFFGESAAQGTSRDLLHRKSAAFWTMTKTTRDVRLASAAYAIWNSAPEQARKADRKNSRRSSMPPVPHPPGDEKPGWRVLVYVRFPDGEDGLISRGRKRGHRFPIHDRHSQRSPLCPPETPSPPPPPRPF